jgi:hypothetical protein
MEEIWKDVPDYEGLYQVSNLGRVRSLPRQLCGKNVKIRKLQNDYKGYRVVDLYCNKIRKIKKVHQLVAMAFLGHKPCGMYLIIDHINDNKLDNRVENLQIVTPRYNARKTQGKYSSQYKGVSWSKSKKKFQASIFEKNKSIFLGLFENEYDAHLAYQNALQNLEQ